MADCSGQPRPKAQCVAPGSSALVLFVGGQGADGSTWEWDGNAWSQRAVTGPPAPQFEGTASQGCSVVLFGGFTGTGPSNDTWVWDGTSWTQRNVQGPSARFGTAMAELGDRVFLFGGLDANLTLLADTWEWDGTMWTQRFVPGPPARSHYAMASLGGKIVLFGGHGGGDSFMGELLGDTWEWDGSAWTQIAVGGPSARSNHAMASIGSTVVLFGGEDAIVNPKSLSDTWSWDGTLWTEQQGAGPPPRAYPAMAGFRGSVLFFGGYDSYTKQNGADTWQWDGTAWTELSVTGPPGALDVIAAR